MKKLYAWQKRNQVPLDSKGRESPRTGKHACNRGWKPGPVKLVKES